MKAKIFSLLFLLLALMPATADDTNGSGARKGINLSQTRPPKPQVMVDEPEAEYNTISGSLTITLDAVSYSEYTIILSSGYANVDYYPTSSVVVFPASALSETTYIYIDSDDCGTYEGVLDMNDIGSNTY